MQGRTERSSGAYLLDLKPLLTIHCPFRGLGWSFRFGRGTRSSFFHFHVRHRNVEQKEKSLSQSKPSIALTGELVGTGVRIKTSLRPPTTDVTWKIGREGSTGKESQNTPLGTTQRGVQ